MVEDDFNTVTETADETVLAPWLSMANAVIEYVPSVTSFQVQEYGAEVLSPSFVVPL